MQACHPISPSYGDLASWTTTEAKDFIADLSVHKQ